MEQTWVKLELAVNNPGLISQSPANELFCNLDGNRHNLARRKALKVSVRETSKIFQPPDVNLSFLSKARKGTTGPNFEARFR